MENNTYSAIVKQRNVSCTLLHHQKCTKKQNKKSVRLLNIGVAIASAYMVVEDNSNFAALGETLMLKMELPL